MGSSEGGVVMGEVIPLPDLWPECPEVTRSPAVHPCEQLSEHNSVCLQRKTRRNLSPKGRPRNLFTVVMNITFCIQALKMIIIK